MSKANEKKEKRKHKGMIVQRKKSREEKKREDNDEDEVKGERDKVVESPLSPTLTTRYSDATQVVGGTPIP